MGVETGRSSESDVDRSKETGEDGGDAEHGHGDLPGHEFTDCGTQSEFSAGTIASEISSRNSALGPPARRPRDGARCAGCGHGRCPFGAGELLVRDCKGKEADKRVTRIDPAVVSPVAEMRGHERQAAQELEQRKTRAE